MNRTGLPTQLARAACAAAFGVLLSLAGGGAYAQKVAPITIVINQSPWFGGFSKAVEAYEKETGNKVALDVNPFAGSAEKQRNSVRSSQGQFDILVMNSTWLAEFYHGGFLTSLGDIDPSFKLDPQVLSYDDTAYWDAKTKTNSAKTGALYGVPLNGNIQLLFYRADLYAQAGLKVPETWEQLLANAQKLHNPPNIYGMVFRGARSASDISYDWMPYLHSHNGAIFKDEKGGDFTVTINSPEGRKALDTYVDLTKKVGPPNPGSYGQAQVIQALVTGKAAHGTPVIAAWSQMDDPTKSAVVGKINVAVLPHGPGGKPSPTLGHFIGAIPKNIPRDRQVAALTFLKWFQGAPAQRIVAGAGAPPIRKDVLESDLAGKTENRWMKAMVDSAPYPRSMYTVPEGPQIVSVLELRLNQAVIGEKSSAEALNLMATEIMEIMHRGGYKTGKLPDLK